MNPYSQWSSNAQGGAPSVFGALPYPAPSSWPSSPSELTTLYFTSFNPTILNCTTVGPQSQPWFSVTTDSSMPGYTVFKDRKGRNVGLIEWQSHPAVEVRSLVQRQNASGWLRLSRDRRSVNHSAADVLNDD